MKNLKSILSNAKETIQRQKYRKNLPVIVYENGNIYKVWKDGTIEILVLKDKIE